MDEDAGVRAPLTRLRRRISVDQTEESKSPAVNTPTRPKRGKTSAKPDLELIDENTNTNTRRITKKTASKEMEPDDKPATPSRRQTRIKSNTSIVSETVLVVDSPRARRAARRASQAGSDSEAPVTPMRVSRRTRKDSTSSVEKDPQLPPTQGIKITEVIIEEPEVISKKSTNEAEPTNDKSSHIRKSPRLLEKTVKTTKNITTEESKNKSKSIDEDNDTPNMESSLTSNKDDPKSKVDPGDIQKRISPMSQSNRLSITSTKLLEDINTKVTCKLNLNKSLSDTENKQGIANRKRSKSWTTLPTSNDSKFYSDNENAKAKIQNNIKSSLTIKQYESGDNSLNINSPTKLIPKKSEIDNANLMILNVAKPDVNKPEQLKENESQIETTSDLLEKEPSGKIETIIFIEDIDSDNSEKVDVATIHETEDQCVPVVKHEVFTQKVNSFTANLDKSEQHIFDKSNKNSSEPMDCEPMDIDETIPENVILPETQTTELNSTGRKSISTSVHISNLSCEERQTKSEINSINTQSLNKSGIETKSTLILSQIKDSSSVDINNVVQSPQVTNIKHFSKSVDDLNITQDQDKKNVSLHYSTSTPLQDKIMQKVKGNFINTSVIASQNIESKNLIKQVTNLFKDHNGSKTEDNDTLENDNVKDSTFVEKKNNKLSKKEENNISSDKYLGKVNEIKKITVTVEESGNDKHSNVNDGEVQTVKGKKTNDVSLSKISKNPRSKSKKNISISEDSEQEMEDDDGDDDDDDGDDDDDDDSSAGKSNFMDIEAVDAGDAYESGDSRSESERQYEKENEVLDQGETLTSDHEFSDDSDYEKDSFIVSSHEEDDELLDGTEDDLSMNNNELNMTAKSKIEYNKRKAKEQKKASREMFESRHKLNSSDKSTHSVISANKTNKRRLISSSESEEDIIKPRKNNRLPLDSTKEASLLADESEHKISKKKNKHFSKDDSSSNESVSNEKEMTISNISIKETDPLSEQIKTEMKTPEKSANSTIAFIDSEEVNNDQIDRNESTKTQTEIFDPLQATMAADDEEDSLSSDDENIIQNYDSILNNLNKSSKLKVKDCDISLNLDKKKKKREKTAIVEELNLTEIKSIKKLKNKQDNVKEVLPTNEDDEASSNSIDLHLLFPEDSISCDTSSLQEENKQASAISEKNIPLKRTVAKSNIHESKDGVESSEVSLDESINKKNKIRKCQHKENTSMEVTENDTSVKKRKRKSSANTTKEEVVDSLSAGNEEVNFYFDTVGTYDNSQDSSLKINKKRSIEKFATADDSETSENIPKTNDILINKSNISLTDDKIQSDESSDDVAPLEISYRKENSSKRKSDQNKPVNVSEKKENSINQSLNKSKLMTPESQTKERGMVSKKDDQTVLSEKKKRKKSGSTSFAEDNTIPPVAVENTATNDKGKEGKKRKKKSSGNTSKEEAIDNQHAVEVTSNTETTSMKRKRKSSLNTTKDEILPAEAEITKTLNDSHVRNKKKKRKINAEEEFVTNTNVAETEANNPSPSNTEKGEINKKRNKKRKLREDDETSSQVEKMQNENLFKRVPRLPSTLLEKLDDLPCKEVLTKKPKVIATTQFSVKTTSRSRSNPSNYLEESIYLNDLDEPENKRNNKKNKKREKPKVLPFVPTASTSTSGFTTSFRINVLPSEVKFVGQSNTISNFKDSYMYNNKIRRLGSYDMYKKQRHLKLSKF